MPSVTRTMRTMPPARKMWKEGFSNQAVRQTAGFYTVHLSPHFNHIWLGTDPAEADELLADINKAMQLVQQCLPIR